MEGIGNKKETKEIGLEKIRIVAGLILASLTTSVLFVEKAEAQKVNLETKQITNPLDTMVGKDTILINNLIQAREDFLEYLKSPKYKERLTKEYIWFKKIYAYDVPAQLLFSFNLNKKKIIDSSGNKRYLEYISGFTKNRNSLFKEELNINNFFKITQEEINSLTKADFDFIDKLIERRISNIQSNKWMIVKDFGQDEDTYGIYFRQKEPSTYKDTNIKLSGLVLIKEEPVFTMLQAFIHELSHQSTDGNSELNEFFKILMKYEAMGDSDYLKNPTEIHARISVFRWFLRESGIYDPNTQDFTRDLLLRIKTDPNLKFVFENEEFNEIFEILDDETIIWIMNNVAFNSDDIYIPDFEKMNKTKQEINKDLSEDSSMA